jgi:hypothetical protein
MYRAQCKSRKLWLFLMESIAKVCPKVGFPIFAGDRLEGAASLCRLTQVVRPNEPF